MKKQFHEKTEEWALERKKIELEIRELSRNYNISLELIEKTTNKQELIEAILNEYIVRLNEIPDTDINKLHQQDEIDYQKEKLKSLIMFATQAASLKEKAELYKKLEEKNRELKIKNNELKIKNEHYLNMLSFVSHELRSPLISILGYAELMADKILGELNDEQGGAIDIIIRVSKNLIDMVKNYLDLAKIETGQMKIKMKKGTVNILEQVIKSVLFEMNDQFAQKQMKVIPLKTLDPKLKIDKELIKIVFRNLFHNAVKYGKDGTEITYSVTAEDEYFLFSIKNIGVGVKQENLSNIFSKFSQLLELQQPDLLRGTGLGLFIAKTIIEKHGGRIWANSKYGEWFQIYFTLPKNFEQTIASQKRSHESPHIIKTYDEFSLISE